MSRKIIPVSTLVHYLKGSLESDPILHGVLVEGEISNIRKPYSGHWYFTLKDSKSSISCVMFSSYNKRVSFDVKNGDKVELRGDVSVYEPGGSLQIMVNAMRQAGIGDLYQKFEELKKKLNSEGLFDESLKKAIPSYPFDIALVTGNQTAAREDVLITLKKRWPVARISEYPCPVQGMEAAPKIIEALQQADNGNHDVILLVRGGGSIEDLWCFNDERLARYLRQMHTPVVTGIGHEIDFTLCDFTSDLRANTPTGAVEAAVPDIVEVQADIMHFKTLLVHSMNGKLQNAAIHLDHLSASPVLKEPIRILQTQKNEMNNLKKRLLLFPATIKRNQMQLLVLQHRFQNSFDRIKNETSKNISEYESSIVNWWNTYKENQINSVTACQDTLQQLIQSQLETKDEKLRMQAALLDAYSPLKILKRGYSVVSKNEQVVSETSMLQKEDHVQIRLSDGSADAIIQEINYANKKHEI